jgi:hypothetical protein
MHAVCAEVHADWHCPVVHFWSTAQTFPHEPQFALSVWSFAQ